MNRKLLSVFFSIAIFVSLHQAKAQSSITLNPGNIFTMNMGLNNMLYDGIEFTNITTDTLILHYKKITKDTIPGCTFDICLSGECYIGIPDSGIYLSYPTPPGQIGWMKMHFWTGNTPGTSKAKLYLYDPAFPNNGDTLTFILNATSLIGINDNIKNNIVAYPNPASDKLVVKNSNAVTEIRLIDIQGKVIKNYFTDMKEEYLIDVKDFSDGIYFTQYIDFNNTIIKTEKIIINNK